MRFEGRESFTSAHEVCVPFGGERAIICFGYWFHDHRDYDYDVPGDKSGTRPYPDTDREGECPSGFSD